jgi:hypothetical protein
MRLNRNLYTKRPADLPLYVADLRHVKLDKDYCTTHIDAYNKRYKMYWGKGLAVYRYSLRTQSGRTISTEYIRARSPKHAVMRIKETWPTTLGVSMPL